MCAGERWGGVGGAGARWSCASREFELCRAVRTLRVGHPHCRHFGLCRLALEGSLVLGRGYEEGCGDVEAAGGRFFWEMRIRSSLLVDANGRGISSNSTRIHNLRVWITREVEGVLMR